MPKLPLNQTEAGAGGGGGAPELQTEITEATTVLTATEQGLYKIYPFNLGTAQTVQVNSGVYVKDDIILIARYGQGSVEILTGSGVTLKGKRDIDNRRFIAYPYTMISILCLGGEEFLVDGNLTLGYTGPVTITSYGDTLNVGDVNKIIPVYGTGLSDNTTITPSAGVTVNSVVNINSTQSNMDVTVTGLEGVDVDFTFENNGDTFIDTAALTIQAAASPLYDGVSAMYTLERPDMTTLWTNYVVRLQRLVGQYICVGVF